MNCKNTTDFQNIIGCILKELNENFDLNNQDFEIEVSIDGDSVKVNSKDEINNKCDCTCKEKLKQPDELTLGEDFIIYIANKLKLPKENVTFDKIMKCLSEDPVVTFIMEHSHTVAYGDLRDYLNEFLSDLLQSLFDTDFSKLRLVHK